MSIARALVFSFIFLSVPGFAQQNPSVHSPDFFTAPGNIGPNAFTGWFWRVDDAKVESNLVVVDVSYRQVKGLRGEWTEAGVARVEIPFKDLASIEFGILTERWRLNDRAQADFETQNRSGSGGGDVVVGIKFDVTKERSDFPAIALHGSIKTASGSFEDRRFTNSAGYSIDALVAKDLLLRTGILKKLRVLTELGFAAWDDGYRTQNDAIRYGVEASFEFVKETSLKAGAQGFTGWRNNGDKPLTLYIQGEKVIRNSISAFVATDIGLTRSSNPVTYSGGLRVKLFRRYFERMQDRRDQAKLAELIEKGVKIP